MGVKLNKKANKEFFLGKNWEYIKTVVDTVREPILILDENLHVLEANESFCRTFQINLKDTKKKLVYELGNGEWNITSLRKLLEEILSKKNLFKGFEIIHKFPFIGRKAMIFNASRIIFEEDSVLGVFPPIILLAMEDATEIMVLAETLAGHTSLFEDRFIERTKKIESNILKLEKEVNKLKISKL